MLSELPAIEHPIPSESSVQSDHVDRVVLLGRAFLALDGVPGQRAGDGTSNSTLHTVTRLLSSQTTGSTAAYSAQETTFTIWGAFSSSIIASLCKAGERNGLESEEETRWTLRLSVDRNLCVIFTYNLRVVQLVSDPYSHCSCGFVETACSLEQAVRRHLGIVLAEDHCCAHRDFDRSLPNGGLCQMNQTCFCVSKVACGEQERRVRKATMAARKLR